MFFKKKQTIKQENSSDNLDKTIEKTELTIEEIKELKAKIYPGIIC